MSDVKPKTRGKNAVKNWGRAGSPHSNIREWLREIAMVPRGDSLAMPLMEFFDMQLGVDHSLKFWHCAKKQFSKWNERLLYETANSAERYRDEFDNFRYPYDGFPSGTSDQYLKKDEVTGELIGMPFRIIHTREITNERAQLAALAYIKHDEVLSNIFNFEGSDDEWDGTKLLGINCDNKKLKLKTKQDWLDQADENWFIWHNGDDDRPQSLDPEKHTVTIISDSVVRTLNWYLKQRNMWQTVNVHRMSVIDEKFRGEKWLTPTALKTFRLDWPVMRNIEEAAELINKTTTKTVEMLVTEKMGEFAAEKVRERISTDVDRIVKEHKGHLDPIDVSDHYEEKWSFYFNAVHPLGQAAPKADEMLSGETVHAEQTTEMPEKVQAKLADIAETLMRIEEKAGNNEGKVDEEDEESGDDFEIISVSPTPNALRDMLNIQMAMNDPAPFEKATAAIYTRTMMKVEEAELLPEGLSTAMFVGYAADVTDPSLTFERLAELANQTFKKHFSGMKPSHGGKDWVSPEMLIWASGDIECEIKANIICPDPRTISAEIRKSLESK